MGKETPTKPSPAAAIDMLNERDLDEVDVILIPAAEAFAKFHKLMEELGVSPRQMLAVLRDRLPVAHQIMTDLDNATVH